MDDKNNEPNICLFLFSLMTGLMCTNTQTFMYDYSDYYFVNKQSCKDILLKYKNSFF